MAEADAAAAAVAATNAADNVARAVADAEDAADRDARAVADAAEAAEAEAVADAADLLETEEVEELEADKSAAGAKGTDRVPGLASLTSPFSAIDEQITDAIIILNRLPNAIEHQAKQELEKVTRKAEQSREWAKEHESELMERADALAGFMGMGIVPQNDAKLRALLTPIEVPENLFNGIEISRTGSMFQSGYEPKQRELARNESGMRAPGPKRKQLGNPEAGMNRSKYPGLYQDDFEHKQTSRPKRRRQDVIQDSSFQSYSEPSRSGFGSGFRQEDVFGVGVSEYASGLRGDLASAGPSFGPRRRTEDVPEGGGLRYRSHLQSNLASAGPSFGSRRVLEVGVPTYGSRPQNDHASARLPFGSRLMGEDNYESSGPNYKFGPQDDLAAAGSLFKPVHRLQDPSENGLKPSAQLGLAGSRENGAPEYRSHAEGDSAFPGQVLSSEPRQSVQFGNDRSTFKDPGVMTGPKRKAQTPPNQSTALQATSAAKPVADANTDGKKGKKKHPVEQACPAIVPTTNGFVELRCDICHMNTAATTGKFWGGIRGFSRHFLSIHKESPSPAEIITRCGIRWLSEEEVKQIVSGELKIEKLRGKIMKGDKQNKTTTQAKGREQRETDVQTDGNAPTEGDLENNGHAQRGREIEGEEEEEEEEEEEAEEEAPLAKRVKTTT